MNSSIAKEPTQRLSAKELIEILEVKKNLVPFNLIKWLKIVSYDKQGDQHDHSNENRVYGATNAMNAMSLAQNTRKNLKKAI